MLIQMHAPSNLPRRILRAEYAFLLFTLICLVTAIFF